VNVNTAARASAKTDDFPDNIDTPAIQAVINMARAETIVGNDEDAADLASLNVEKDQMADGIIYLG
jgi:hypothetical protein